MKKLWKTVRLLCSTVLYWFRAKPVVTVKHDGVRFVVDMKERVKQCRHQKPASKCNDEECIIRYVTGS